MSGTSSNQPLPFLKSESSKLQTLDYILLKSLTLKKKTHLAAESHVSRFKQVFPKHKYKRAAAETNKSNNILSLGSNCLIMLTASLTNYINEWFPHIIIGALNAPVIVI